MVVWLPSSFTRCLAALPASAVTAPVRATAATALSASVRILVRDVIRPPESSRVTTLEHEPGPGVALEPHGCRRPDRRDRPGAARGAPQGLAQSGQGDGREGDGDGLARRRAAGRPLPPGRRDPGHPLARRPGAPPRRLPRRGRRPPAPDRGGDEGLELARRPPGPGRGRRGRGAPHGPPLHRRRVAQGRAEGAARAVGRRRRHLGRPARRGHGDQRGGRPVRRALPGGAGDAARPRCRGGRPGRRWRRTRSARSRA